MKKRSLIALMISTALMLSFSVMTSCNKKNYNEKDSGGADKTPSESVAPPEAADIDTSDKDLEFSKGDTDSGYDEAAATVINASAGDTVSLTRGGTYILKGSLDSCITVNIPKNEIGRAHV